MTARFHLGIDGGGTGCRARLETPDGVVLGQGFAGPASTRFGIDAAFAAIMTAADAAIAEAGLTSEDIKHIAAGVGLAGYGRKGAPEALALKPHPFASLAFDSDVVIACLGAHAGGDGGILIIGTGSCGIARVAGRAVRVGGYGFPVSDEGSGADLGLRAIRLALRAHDGRYPPSALTEELMRRFHGDPYEVVAWMDKATATDYATFAPMVMRHADQGDAAGRAVVQAAANEADNLARALQAAGSPRLSLIGGLASALEAWLAPDVRRRLSPPKGDALDGALLLAGRPPKPAA
jgi:glucosamine kinase